MNRTPAAVVFDLDGTLVDSVPDIHAAVLKMLDEFDRPALPRADVAGFVGNGVVRLVSRVMAATGGADAPTEARALARFREHYGAAPAALTQPYPAAGVLLERLAGRGVALGLCTNKPLEPTRDLIAALGWDRRFASVVAGDSLAVMKPDPAPLKACVDALDIGTLGDDAASVLYVGDSETDEATAQAAGIPFALFAGGYRKKPAEAFDAVLRFDHHDQLARALGL